MLELSEGTKKSKGKQTQEPSKQAASQACQSRLKVNDWKKLNFFETFWKKLLTMCTPDDIIYKSPR